MKKLCSITLDGERLDYLLDIGKRSNSYICVKDGVVTVRLPLNGSQRNAEELLIAHGGWLHSKLKQSEDKSRLPRNFSDGESFSLLGQRFRLQIAESAEYMEPLIENGVFTLYTAPGMTKDDAGRLFMRYICEVCEKRVKQAFDKYIPILGLAPKKITIKKMSSRWGSCSSNGNISVNIDVVCFEQECIDYVVIHELCHLKHMDHGEKFWKLVSVCCPNYKALRERMKH